MKSKVEGHMGVGAGSAGEFPAARSPVTVSDVVRDVVAKAFPAELPLVAALSRFDDGTVVRRLTRRSRPREPLGFGLDEVAALLTPVLWIALEDTVRRIVDSAETSVAKKSKVLLRKLLRRRPARLTVPPLTHEQIAEVQQRVLEIAACNGLDQERAVMLADLLGETLAPKEKREIGADPAMKAYDADDTSIGE
ncbi:MAG: hypothetical protein ACRDRO_26470 [Pseudonocardiaceae bacterium]